METVDACNLPSITRYQLDSSGSMTICCRKFYHQYASLQEVVLEPGGSALYLADSCMSLESTIFLQLMRFENIQNIACLICFI